jgi:hypothetical protein
VTTSVLPGGRVLSREVSLRSSSFLIEEVEVALATREVCRLVVKHLSVARMLGDARRIRPRFVLEPRREVEMYRSVLRHEVHGTARFYGAFASEEGGWMLALEHVDAAPLEETSYGPSWHEAARWLAWFHSSFAERPVDCESWLVAYDAAYFGIWPDRAVGLAQRTGTRASDLEDLKAIASSYGAVAAALASQPTALVHGDFNVSNVLVSPGDASRVCVLDWEMAGRGPALLDLAALTCGVWPSMERDSLIGAYRDAAGECSSNPAGSVADEEFEIWLDLCTLHVAMQWLGWADDWHPEQRRTTDWAEVVRSCASRIGL